MKKTILTFTFLVSIASYSSEANADNFNAQKLPLTQDRANEPEVFQREYIVTQKESNEFIQTIGLTTCVALIVYNPVTQTALLAHLDAATKIDKEISRFAKEVNFKKSKISMIGGVKGSLNFFNRLRKKVESLGGVVSQIAHNELKSRGINVRLNLKTGEVSRYFETVRATPYPIVSAKTDRLVYTRSRLFRHEESLGGGDTVTVDSTDTIDLSTSGI